MTQPATIDATARDITPTRKPKRDKPLRLTEQQERFVREFIKCGVGATAYRRAYRVKEDTLPTSVYVSASKLLAKPNIEQRLMQLRNARARETIDTVLTEFDQNRHGALEDRNWSAANGATRGKAQVLGLIPHNPEGGVPAGTTIIINLVAQDEGLF